MTNNQINRGWNSANKVLEYFIALAEKHFMVENGKRQYKLANGYHWIKTRVKKSALPIYLGPARLQTYPAQDFLIFPFGCNASQYQAVNNALSNQVSIIQGPPGTGKTQTILNILANLLVQEKSALVVSNNNEAIRNVKDKLAKSQYDMDFLVATLGARDNQTDFLNELRRRDFASIKERMKKWELPSNQLNECMGRVRDCSQKIHTIFTLMTRKAQIQQELRELQAELEHYRREQDIVSDVSAIEEIAHLSDFQLLSFLNDYQTRLASGSKFNLMTKLLWTFRYRIWKWSIYRADSNDVFPIMQLYYYQKREEQLTKELEQVTRELDGMSYKKTLAELENQSLRYLRAKVALHYFAYPQKSYPEGVFLAGDEKVSSDFLKRFPIVLSTTFSSPSASHSNVPFDYVIMDEASQIDVVTGAQAMSKAKNMVLVGDRKQLPNIVTNEQLDEWEPIFRQSQLPENYSPTLSFLESVELVIPQAPVQLLREHYRCHPKIINFCNQEFYNGELVIMTEDQGEEDVMVVYRTVPGNHNRGNYNQRQIDVLEQEVIGRFGLDPKTTGTISPFKNHNSQQRSQVASFSIDTVHKYQGKEQDNIVFSTVVDRHNDFVADPRLVNVAVSRAKNRFILVMTGNEVNTESSITHLADYIRYYDLTEIDSQVVSIYDYLYSQYKAVREKMIAQYQGSVTEKSEILTAQLIEQILSDNSFQGMSVISHYTLLDLVSAQQMSLLTPQERRFVESGLSHIDFLIYGRTSKKPILAIEVDGYKFHAAKPEQLERDKLKDSILKNIGIELLRLPTNGSGEAEKIRKKLAQFR